MAYSPKYLDSLNDVPVQIPDDFNSTDKSNAVQLAEALIEVDLEDGSELNTVTAVHKAAIKQRATCELAKGASDPDSVSIGDVQDDGMNKTDFAHEAFCNHYNDLVAKIRRFMEEDTGGPYVYSTSKSEEREEWEEFEENIDIDFSEDPTQRDNW